MPTRPITRWPSFDHLYHRARAFHRRTENRTGAYCRWPNMRYSLASRRPHAMKRTLTCTVLAVFFGLQASLAMAKAVSTPESWEYLQPDRDQVIASLNVVELLKRLLKQVICVVADIC